MRSVLLALVLLVFAAARAHAAEDLLIADFEGADYGAWKATGQAFGPGPAQGTLPNQMQVSGFLGKGLVNSFSQGDGTTGTLASPPFRIERRYLNFLIGGGKDPERLCIRLLVAGKVARTATGPNDRPGGSERLDWHTWDVGDLLGETATLEIVDQATGGWGHINVDHIVQSDKKAAEEWNMELVLAKRYLNFPVKQGAPKRRLSLLVDGKPVREFEIELAPDQPEFWAFLDVSAFRGKKATLHLDAVGPDVNGLQAISQDDAIRGAEDLYREKHRPQFHFSSRRGWNNDPNGLVFFQGEYHLYYQHNPYGWNWGNMHWGHAVSPDLVHWQELPVALYPHQFGDWAFSGSAVVDAANTSGFKAGDEDVIVAAYTSTGRGEAIAYSNDRGRTFTEYEGNPVVKHSGRDPRLLWHEASKQWVMAVYDEHEGKRWIAFYTSPDLKAWQYRSRIEGFYECPDLYELAVDGDPANRKWVLSAADGDYLIGRFDGQTFTPVGGKQKGNYGNCFYAAQTYSNIPPRDGRRIQIGWARSATPGMPFNQMMAFPCELSLRTTDEGIRLFANPAREIEKLHREKHAWTGRDLKEGENLLAGLSGDLLHLRAEIALGDAAEVGFTLRGVPVVYDARRQTLTCKTTAPLKPVDGKIRLEILVDRTSIEIFGNNGRVYLPIAVIPPDGNRSLESFARGGTAKAVSLEVWELNSAWQ